MSTRQPPATIARLLLCAGLALASGLASAADGEIRKIDAAQMRLTLKHEAIPSLDMPAMTMTYKAPSATLLQGLAVGDQVVFEAEKRDGAYVVTAIRKK
ncbi:MAG: copper-binding protein [Burkholderiales bacterium]|nr:copper-binding protein [Burkholderiales bacterium]